MLPIVSDKLEPASKRQRGLMGKPLHSLHTSQPEVDPSSSRSNRKWPNSAFYSHTLPENVFILTQTLRDTQGNSKLSVSCHVHDVKYRANSHSAWCAPMFLPLFPLNCLLYNRTKSASRPNANLNILSGWHPKRCFVTPQIFP